MSLSSDLNKNLNRHSAHVLSVRNTEILDIASVLKEGLQLRIITQNTPLVQIQRMKPEDYCSP